MTLTRRGRDTGAILPLVLACTVVMSIVGVALADYATTDLRYSHVTEDRSDRLAAADAGMRYAIDQIKLRDPCVFDDTKVHVLPGLATQFNGASASVTCELITDGIDDGILFALVATGEGVNSGNWLLVSQSGGGSDEPKTLGGPVYLDRIDDQAIEMSAPLVIEDGWLNYYDANPNCTTLSQATVIARAEGYLSFQPPQVYGPWCTDIKWSTRFPSPWTPDLSGLPSAPIDGSVAYDDTTYPGCRVFAPGYYVTPPSLTGTNNAYFQSGNYVFNFPSSGAKFDIKGAVATFGVPHPTLGTTNERPNTPCDAAQAADRSSIEAESDAVLRLRRYGATIYLAGRSHVEISSDGALEIHGREQGPSFISVQTLCVPALGTWCRDEANFDPDDPPPTGMYGGDGGLDASYASTLTASSSDPDVLFTQSGNGKEFIAHGRFYAPLATVEFGNATSTAEQKMLGGLVAATVHLQASASATNFEIAVPTSPITGQVEVTSTATKNGQTTSIRAVLEFRYSEDIPDDRVRVNSWRVCHGPC